MSKHSTGTCYIHKFQNTTKISHIFFHRYKSIVIFRKNYSIIHVILNKMNHAH